jgi:hypothetical protein
VVSCWSRHFGVARKTEFLMRQLPPARVKLTVALAALFLAACGGGGGGQALAPDTAGTGTPMAIGHAPQAVMRAAVAPGGVTWTQAGVAPRIWHSLASDGSGQVLVGGEARTARCTSHATRARRGRPRTPAPAPASGSPLP